MPHTVYDLCNAGSETEKYTANISEYYLQPHNQKSKFDLLFNVWPGNLKFIVEVVISTYHICLFSLLCEVVTQTIQFQVLLTHQLLKIVRI